MYEHGLLACMWSMYARRAKTGQTTKFAPMHLRTHFMRATRFGVNQLDPPSFFVIRGSMDSSGRKTSMCKIRSLLPLFFEPGVITSVRPDLTFYNSHFDCVANPNFDGVPRGLHPHHLQIGVAARFKRLIWIPKLAKTEITPSSKNLARRHGWTTIFEHARIPTLAIHKDLDQKS